MTPVYIPLICPSCKEYDTLRLFQWPKSSVEVAECGRCGRMSNWPHVAAESRSAAITQARDRLPDPTRWLHKERGRFAEAYIQEHRVPFGDIAEQVSPEVGLHRLVFRLEESATVVRTGSRYAAHRYERDYVWQLHSGGDFKVGKPG